MERLEAYKLRKAKIECYCLCCLEIIEKGNYKYVKVVRTKITKCSLCIKCYIEWKKRGCKLSNTPRNKKV